jgi:hypothetical protein
MEMTTRTSLRVRRAQPRRRTASLYADLLTVAIAIGASFYVHLIGELFIADILLLASLPILLALHARRVFRPGLKVALVLMGLWLFGQMMSDIYRQTARLDALKGDANILFFAFALASLAVLIGRNDRRKVIFLAAYAIGSLLGARLEPTIDISGDPWKWGYSTGVNIGVVLISCYFFRRRMYLITGILLAGVIAINLIENFRSQVLFLLVTAVLVVPIIPERVGRLRLLPRAGTASRVLVVALLALAAAGAADGLVHLATTAGLLGEDAQAKNESELQGKAGLLLGGRPEILVSSRAVLDSPILGHGSYARDYKYVEMLVDLQTRMGIPPEESMWDLEEGGSGLIPAHSHLMSAWVYAGVLGAIFWIYLWPLTLKGILKVAILKPPLTPIYTYMLIGLLWDILFSPFGAQDRITCAFLVVVLVDLLNPATSIAGKSKWLRSRKWQRRPLRGDPAFAGKAQIVRIRGRFPG